ncbi:MAG TPA: alcohol dehydrogenase catalytic domain-containing protein [Steroidobacteraceae bacterium]|nr:alcohol dehydrogenase catalytic domain-containing protein [Steroidobacteraceae bacterium]
METTDQKLSRRDVLAAGIAATGSVLAATQAGAVPAPALLSAQPSIAGRKFRAWVSQGEGAERTRLETLTLLPISGRQVAVRTQAASLCYTVSSDVLGLPRGDFGAADTAHPLHVPPPTESYERFRRMALIQGHGGVGIVEAIGPEVRRVRVGDRVCVSGTPQCGSCYQCLRGRADMCQFLGHQGPSDLVALATRDDGTPVYANSHIGGLSEMMVTFEEWVVPVHSEAPSHLLSMVCSCTSVAGLGSTVSQTLATIGPSCSVAVVGCGPLGLTAVQGARIAGASIIIAIDPIRVRREVARKVGATHVLDPNAEGANLLKTIRDITKGGTDYLWGGGKNWTGFGSGPDFVVEAAGANRAKPMLEDGPDPTGLLPMQQAYLMCAPGGNIVTNSLPVGNISLPVGTFALGGRSQHAGQAGGMNPMRDIPRFVALLDSGQFDAKSLATTVVPLEGMIDAYREVLYRTTIQAHIRLSA